MPTHTRLAVTNAVLDSMMRQERFLQEFAFLRNPPKAAVTSGCNCRRRRSKASKTVDYNALRAAIAGLPGSRKLKLRSMLDAKQLKVTYRAAGGKIRTILF